MYTYIYIYVSVYVCVYIFIYIYICTHTYTSIYIYVYTCIYIFVCIYICTYILLHQDLMAAGKMWEDNGDPSKAIDSYLKVTSAQTRNVEYLEEIWEKAVELAMTRCTGRITEVVSEVSKRLVDLGRFEQVKHDFENFEKKPIKAKRDLLK